MNKFFCSLILIIILVIILTNPASAATLYSDNFINSYDNYFTSFGSCTPTNLGLKCTNNALSVNKTHLNNVKCIYGVFTTPLGIQRHTHHLLLWEDAGAGRLGRGALFYIPTTGNFRLGNYPQSDIDSGIPAPTSGTYNYGLCKDGDTYTTYIDGKKIQSEIFPGLKPTQIGFQLLPNSLLTNFIATDTLPDKKPTPFLDLPFHYGNKTFEQVALNPESWFDHAYPLQNIFCCNLNVRKYSGGSDVRDAYRSHSGYDYARSNGVKFHTPVLAAASGNATFVPEQKSGGAGNMIKITHGNGYQTWYEHLDSTSLVVSAEGVTVPVVKGQQIGKVGMTGNTNGPHIHFSVLKDSNKNNLFSDDYPIGLVDPLGWEGTYTDPWTLYEVNGRKGAESYNLFINKTEPKSKLIAKNLGGVIDDKNVKVSIKPNTLPLDFTIKVKYGPFESDDTIESVVPTLYLTAFNNLGDQIKTFVQPIEIEYSYAEADLLNIDEDSIKLYHYDQSTNTWDTLPSSIDKQNKRITGQTMHFSQFALMGDIKDTIAPSTYFITSGFKNFQGIYRSAVSVELQGKDNDGGVGVSETLYKINDGEWYVYTGPFSLNNSGEYIITYKTIDNAYNVEQFKTTKVTLDLSPVTYRSTLNDIFQADDLELIKPGLAQSLSSLVKNAEKNGTDNNDSTHALLITGINSLEKNKSVANNISSEAYEILHYDLSTLFNALK